MGRSVRVALKSGETVTYSGTIEMSVDDGGRLVLHDYDYRKVDPESNCIVFVAERGEWLNVYQDSKWW